MRVTLRLKDGITSDEGLLKVHELTELPFVIGRSPDASWTLTDPSNRISGAHVEMRRKGEDVILVDLSSGGTGLNSAANRLVRDQPIKLPDDCTLVLPVGTIAVSVERENQGPLGQVHEKDDFFSLGEVRRERSRRRPDTPRANPAALLGDDAPSNPLRAPVSSAPAAFDAAAAAQSLGQESASTSRLLNPGDLLGGAMAPAARQPAPELPTKPVQRPNPLGTDIPEPLPDAVSLPDVPARPDPVVQPDRSVGVAKSAGASWLDDEDEDDPFGGPAPQGEAVKAAPVEEPEPEPQAEPASEPARQELHGSETEATAPAEAALLDPDALAGPSAPAQTHPGQATASAVVPKQEPEADAQRPTQGAGSEGLDALLAVLGVPTDLDDAQKLALAGEIARTYAAMADAMRQMLATRAEVKRALGIVATEVEIGANPLKTARDRTAAVDGLIRPLSSGFLSGEAAVEDSLHSMQAHQYAMVSGIKAALQKTLDAFNPDTLEEKMTKRGLASWLPGQRKAALWDSFVTNYEMFSEQAAENFRMLIGRELDNLYQTRRDHSPGWPEDKK